jgi:hypothetical protein
MAKITASPPVPPDDAPDDAPHERRDQRRDEPDQVPAEEPEPREPPAEASTLGAFAEEGKEPAPTWDPKYRSALDNPKHPLHHLRNA